MRKFPVIPGFTRSIKLIFLPIASDPSFFDWLIDVCRLEQVHAILSGTEPILTVLARAKRNEYVPQAGAICIVSSTECLCNR